MIEKLNYRKINLDESDEIFQLLKEAAKFLKERSIDYWQNWHNPPKEHINWILNGLKNEQFYFALNNNDIVGMFRLQYNDELFWGKRDDLAGYIHSFTTLRKYKGQKIGTTMLDDIEKKLFEKGIHFIRLDCSSNISGLCNYYEKHGFKAIGTIKLFGDNLNLYEKNLETIY
ncbi:MAG: GNAT family N-acetyltransferase [Clostridiales bacterium]